MLFLIYTYEGITVYIYAPEDRLVPYPTEEYKLRSQRQRILAFSSSLVLHFT